MKNKNLTHNHPLDEKIYKKIMKHMIYVLGCYTYLCVYNHLAIYTYVYIVSQLLVRKQRDKSTVKKIHQYQMHLGKFLRAPYKTDIIRYRKNFSVELRFYFSLEKWLNDKIFEILRPIKRNLCKWGPIYIPPEKNTFSQYFQYIDIITAHFIKTTYIF